jgi:DNA-binding CsgD family transcriptional regulator
MTTGRGQSRPDSANSLGRTNQLTARQLEILALLRAGRANKEIAYELGIGIGTVKQHVVALFRKLNVTNRAAAVSRGNEFDWRAGNDAPLIEAAEHGAAVEARPVTILSMREDGRNNALNRAVSVAVGERDCTLVMRPNDGVDIIFGLHRVDERDCLDALAVAYAASNGLREEFHRSGAPAPALRAGLSTGMALVSVRRRGGWTGESVAGRPIARARDLRDVAAPGRLEMDEASRRMMAFALRSANDGERQSELTLPLDRATDRLRRGCRTTPAQVIHGRRDEKARLDAALASLAEGRGTVVWVEGESGMGKTTLCRALRSDAAAMGAAWIDAGCGAVQPLGEVLATLGRGQGRPPAQAVIGNDDALAGVDRLLRKGPLAVLVEDCHRATDDETRLMLGLAGMVTTRPLLLLGAGRAARHPLLQGAGTAIRLGRMGQEDLSAVIADEAGGRLPPPLVDRVLDLAAGVPLFAVELTRAAVATGLSVGDALPLPLSLVALVLSRIDSLDLDRHLLRLVARRGDAELSALSAGWDGIEAEFEAELGRAVAAGVLSRSRDHAGFAHPLVGEVVRQTMLAAGGEGGRTLASRVAMTREAG